jgi:hypothetical protein
MKKSSLFSLCNIDSQKVQLLLVLLTMALFVIGAAAPGITSPPGQ